ncbi:unnamed protein product [Macrosiphum euphorbiae]|uniref:Transposable element P transposase-like C-terminal domain-containing protein n=1 Tax=Macrosiphum euphorbiae TaxID=13131 RepID=A0AAV0XSH2_9HEMI|nr:unnamed protein product [Macrosiphum euphorbiae]
MTKDAVEYLIGWVAKKYRKKYPELGSTTYVLGNTCHDYTLPTWVQHLSYGGLIVPSSNFKNLILRCEKLFIKFTKGQIPTGRYIVKQLTNKIYNRVITDDKNKILIQTYIKQRIIIRMKYFNQNLTSMQKIKKSKMRLQRLNKLRKTIT